MIEFVEIIPVRVLNPNFENELQEWKESREFFLATPEEYIIRHENKELGTYDYVQLINNEHIEIEGEQYIVKFSDPKQFIQGGFVQKVYVRKIE
jgi:hypothetical protein